jgi:hypothetical protein
LDSSGRAGSREESAKGIFFLISDVLQKKEGAQPFFACATPKGTGDDGGRTAPSFLHIPQSAQTTIRQDFRPFKTAQVEKVEV